MNWCTASTTSARIDIVETEPQFRYAKYSREASTMNSHGPTTITTCLMCPRTILFVSFLFSGCTGTEKAIAPLGFGPLAQAEEAEQKRLAAQRQEIDYKKPSRDQVKSDFPSKSFGSTQVNVDVPVKKAEPASPAASSAIAQAPPTPTKLPDWLGLWHGKDTTRYQIPSFPPQPMDDPNARIRVESPSNQQISLILIDTSTGNDICALSAHVESNLAKVEPGQDCFGNEDDSMNLSVHIRTGTATLRDSTLVVDLILEATVQSEQFQANGTVDYHFEGKR